MAPDTADALERAVNAGAGGMLELATTDGRLTVSVPRVVYVKRYTKGAQPGFLAVHLSDASPGGAARPDGRKAVLVPGGDRLASC